MQRLRDTDYNDFVAIVGSHLIYEVAKMDYNVCVGKTDGVNRFCSWYLCFFELSPKCKL